MLTFAYLTNGGILMEAEIIAVGTELTLGQVVNTNTRYLADQLGRLGIVAPWQVTVDDDPERIREAIHQASVRARLIIICGGLGPTADDQTMAATAAALECGLTVDTAYWRELKARLAERTGGLIRPENEHQARYLAGGEALKNPVGMALGAYKEVAGRTYVVLPGPPKELTAMVEKSLLPRLREAGLGAGIDSRLLHFVGRPESLLAVEATRAVADPKIAVTTYVQPTEIQLRLTIVGLATGPATAALDGAVARIKTALGPYYVGEGAGVTLAGQVVHALAAQGKTVTGAESLTGGLFQATICGVPGASRVFAGGFVTYAARAKEKLIGVSPATIANEGVVSAATAAAMATGCRDRLATDFGLAFTGVAGPEELEGQPAGTVWLGLAERGREPVTKLLHLPGLERQAVRLQSVQEGLLMLYQRLQK